MYENKNVLFQTNKTVSHVDHNQLDDPLTFKIIHTNHYTDFKSITILVNMKVYRCGILHMYHHMPFLGALVDCSMYIVLTITQIPCHFSLVDSIHV